MKSLPKNDLGFFPTPLYELKRLSRELKGSRIFIKRDDQTGLAFGGNKTRKLEYLGADAISQGCKTLITAGAIQSNHCRQTAAAARALGLDCILVLGGDEPEIPQANTFLDQLLGAEIIWTERKLIKSRLKEAFQEAQIQGKSPYLVPYGGSNPTGAASYAYALEEALNQEPDLDWIVFATSSGGTQAGLEAGKRILSSRVKILGISVDEPGDRIQKTVQNLAEAVISLLDTPRGVPVQEIMVNEDYLGEGYAIMGQPELEAIRLFASLEGILLDPVYTGRAAAGLLDLIRRDYFKPDERILFWHTGGTPVLFDEKYSSRIVNSSKNS